MKKAFLSILCSLGLLAAAQAQVVINEIMYNPPESGTDSLEYIELYNVGSTAVDVSGWSIGGITFSFPAATSIPGKGYAVVAVNANAFKNAFGFLPFQFTSGGLNNSGEPITLTDASGTEVDKVDYKNALPWPPEGNGNGNSIVLCDPTSDNSQPINWQACPTPANITVNGKAVFANPNAASACSGSSKLVAVNDQVIANSPVAVTFNPTTNDLLPNPVASFSLLALPKHGTASVNATDKTITYQADQGYCGRDTLQYKICDNALCDTATVFIRAKCYTPHTLAETAANDNNGVSLLINQDVELTGTVYGVNLRPGVGSFLFTIIDDAGNGISVSSVTGDFGYTVKEKDKVSLFGTIANVSGLTTVLPDFFTKISANNPLVNPTVVTKLGEATESKLIRINNLHLVDPTKWTNGLPAITGFTVNAVSDNSPSDTIAIRIDRDVEIFNATAPAAPFSLIGLGGQFDGSSPFNSGYQVLPRYNPDIFPTVGTKEADFSAHVRLAPNPVQDVLLLTTDISFDRLRILSADGVLVQTLENPALTMQIQVQRLPAGIYFTRFEKDGAVWTTQFVKM